ncbi:MAG TPA: STAS domain-containing protein [Streptosporangiaceae bacterium]
MMNPGTTIHLDSVRTADGITIAELAGQLDLTGVSALREQLLGLLRPDAGRLVLDLSRVTFCDASGLAVLIGTSHRARRLGGFLRLAAVSPQVDRVLDLTGLRRHLTVFPTVRDATAAPGGQDVRGRAA